MKKRLKTILIFLLVTMSFPLFSLVTLEGLTLGKLDLKENEIPYDPLSYIFGGDFIDEGKELYFNISKESNQELSDTLKKELKSFNEVKEGVIKTRSFSLQQLKYLSYLEDSGRRLQSSCLKEGRPSLQYSTLQREDQAKRSFIANFQYMGLDITTRAIAKYAKFLEFSEEEYLKLVAGMVTNFCTKNLTVISLKELGNNLLSKFKHGDNSFDLPLYSNNIFFSPKMDQSSDLKKVREFELLYTIKLFRAFCSWDGDINNFRLLVPHLKSPEIMSYLSDELSGETKVWNPKLESYQVKEKKMPLRVVCEGHICRRIVENREYLQKIPLSYGSRNPSFDFETYYCDHLRDLNYIIKEQEPHLKKWILEMDSKEEGFLNSHLIALISGIPSLLFRVASSTQSSKNSELQSLLKTRLLFSISDDFERWAFQSQKRDSHDLKFEESLTIEKGESEVNEKCLADLFKEHRKLEEIWNKEKLKKKQNEELLQEKGISAVSESALEGEEIKTEEMEETKTEEVTDRNDSSSSLVKSFEAMTKPLLALDSNRICIKSAININLGEMDRVLKDRGKIPLLLRLKFSERFISWFLNEMSYYAHPKYLEKRKVLKGIFKEELKKELNKALKHLLFIPWEGSEKEVEELLADAFIESLQTIPKPFKRNSSHDLYLGVKINYSPFALRYMVYRFKLRHGEDEIDKNLQ